MEKLPSANTVGFNQRFPKGPTARGMVRKEGNPPIPLIAHGARQTFHKEFNLIFHTEEPDHECNFVF